MYVFATGVATCPLHDSSAPAAVAQVIISEGHRAEAHPLSVEY